MVVQQEKLAACKHTEEVLIPVLTSKSLCDTSDVAVLGRQGHTSVAAEMLVQPYYAQLLDAGHLQPLHTLCTIGGKASAGIRASSTPNFASSPP